MEKRCLSALRALTSLTTTHLKCIVQMTSSEQLRRHFTNACTEKQQTNRWQKQTRGQKGSEACLTKKSAYAKSTDDELPPWSLFQPISGLSRLVADICGCWNEWGCGLPNFRGMLVATPRVSADVTRSSHVIECAISVDVPVCTPVQKRWSHS